MTAASENSTGPAAPQAIYTDDDLADARRARNLLTGASELLQPSRAGDRVNASLAASMTAEALAALSALLGRMERATEPATGAAAKRTGRGGGR